MWGLKLYNSKEKTQDSIMVTLDHGRSGILDMILKAQVTK